METKPWAISLMILVTFLTSVAQLLYKFATANLRFSFFGLISNYYLISGIVIYAVGAILFVLALKGGDVSILYPIIATSYIWVNLLSKYILNENINIYKWFGIAAIFAGVSLISINKNNKSKVQK